MLEARRVQTADYYIRKIEQKLVYSQAKDLSQSVIGPKKLQSCFYSCIKHILTWWCYVVITANDAEYVQAIPLSRLLLF